MPAELVAVPVNWKLPVATVDCGARLVLRDRARLPLCPADLPRFVFGEDFAALLDRGPFNAVTPHPADPGRKLDCDPKTPVGRKRQALQALLLRLDRIISRRLCALGPGQRERSRELRTGERRPIHHGPANSVKDRCHRRHGGTLSSRQLTAFSSPCRIALRREQCQRHSRFLFRFRLFRLFSFSVGSSLPFRHNKLPCVDHLRL